MATELLDLSIARKDFPLLEVELYGKPLAYLDNAATAQRPLAVIEAVDRFWRLENASVHRGVHKLSQISTQLYEDAREDVRRFMNARSVREIIFTKGCTEGINLVAQSYGRANLKPGDEILISTMEHHSNIVSWQLIADQVGAKIKVIPISDEGEILLDEYEKLLSERTKIVGIVHVSNSVGTINPVKKMIQMAHAVGAVVLVDGAQAGPHIRVDVQDLDADFYTLSCHKIYAPTGVGVLYGKEHLLEAMPPYQGGGGMIRTVTFEKTTYAELPDKFEAGTPNVGGVVGLGAAVRYLESLTGSLTATMDAIHNHEADIVGYATSRTCEIPGVRVIGTAPNKAGILSFVMEGVHPHDIGTILDSEAIAIRAGHHCCMPLMKRMGVPATARASFAFYNTREEADRLIEGVKKAKETFA